MSSQESRCCTALPAQSFWPFWRLSSACCIAYWWYSRSCHGLSKEYGWSCSNDRSSWWMVGCLFLDVPSAVILKNSRFLHVAWQYSRRNHGRFRICCHSVKLPIFQLYFPTPDNWGRQPIWHPQPSRCPWLASSQYRHQCDSLSILYGGSAVLEHSCKRVSWSTSRWHSSGRAQGGSRSRQLLSDSWRLHPSEPCF